MKSDYRFKVRQFTNPRTESASWRVDGIRRDGQRVRENFQDEPAARCRQIELETEYLQGHVETSIRATKLTTDQVRLAEVAMVQLGDDWTRILDAVANWKQHGKQKPASESPRLDDAVSQYLLWLEASPFRDATKRHWRIRMTTFQNSVPNIHIAEATPEFIKGFLDRRSTCIVGKDTDRRAISRFFSWCIENKWLATNPARKQTRSRRAEPKTVDILNVDQCKALLRAAEPARLAPYVGLCLFAGIRPTEASRLDWMAVNLKDKEIRLEANQTKTGTARVVAICPTLLAWLKAYEGQPIFPTNWRKAFAAVKVAAAITTWPVDVMRHTGISHFFRSTGSYGLTAEQFGNSEAIIKAHYQGRVSSTETERFYAIKPTKGTK